MIILISGGASGLGEAITRKLAQKPENKIYFTFSKSEDSAKKIEKDFSNCFSIKCDFDNEADLISLKNKIAELNLDVLVNNAYAGEAIKTYFHKIPAVDFLTDFKRNIIPTVEITQTAINCFRKKKSGKIISILTSFIVNIPPMGSAIYVANKAYLEQLSKVWASENIKFGITSNSVSPSFMLTNMTSNVDERIIEDMIDKHPLKKILTPSEVAESVNFLVTASDQINGINILINAGSNIQ